MIVELRQYTLHPGTRETLVELFEREFLESQDAAGMRVLGQFRDLDDPNRFVWIRSFRDMPARALALQAFYGGPVWKAHRDAANATMIDSDNVLLLRPASARSASRLARYESAARFDDGAQERLAIAAVYSLDGSEQAEFPEFFERELEPLLADAGASFVASLVTEHSANNFPALPVRENENVLVILAAIDAPADWTGVRAALERHRGASPQLLRLLPTTRSIVP